ncbi:MAG: hypothetical protein IT378_24910 [Sandaracinaceae bacterium]|nr:hypothetical protein [Sandaracinaceae bacterium]
MRASTSPLFSWLTVLGLAVIGCHASGASMDASAPPVCDPILCARPPIEDCVTGATFAECPGTSASDPILACRRSDHRCYWFTGGCTPAIGFEPSCCAASNYCCFNDYPFGDEWRNLDRAGNLEAFWFLYGWGTEPWTRGRGPLLETRSEALPEMAPSIACTGPTPAPPPPCGESSDGLRVTSPEADDLVLQLSFVGPSLGSWSLYVEAWGEGGLASRVCRVPSTDGISFSCRGMPGPSCATSGSTAIDWTRRRAHVVAQFPDGLAIDAWL